VMCFVELGLLLIFTEITAGNAASQLAGVEDAAGKWIRHLGDYLVVDALPYALPFIVAFSLHRELRSAVFVSAKEAEKPVPSGPEIRSERRQAKRSAS